jgi:Terminase large subunit, T4likevirus-type, N-terminal
MTKQLHEIAYRLDPVLWVRDVLEITPHAWQERFLRAERGASIAVLTARQVGKTTAAAVGMAHSAIFYPGSLSVIACPTQNQSAEALRKVRDMVIKAGADLAIENRYSLELTNRSRVLALPGTHESIRGLTVDAWIVADEAAQLDPAIMAALHPMRTQRPNARFAMLSTAWSRTDPFWSVWASKDPSWTRIPATIDVAGDLIAPEVIERARHQLSADDFNREYLGIPGGTQISPFTFKLYEQATRAPGPDYFWQYFRPHMIAHDVGHMKDRSTAVIGGNSLLLPNLIGIKEFRELPQGFSGHARAEELASIDRSYGYISLIFADLSYDPSYADILVERFGERVIGLQITSSGDTIDNFEWRLVKNGKILVYKVSRTLLLELLLRELQGANVRILPGSDSMHAYEQLMRLEVERKQNHVSYKCPSGYHDDLAISCAMLVWAAQHPHLSWWCRPLEPRPPQNTRPAPSAKGWT